MIPSSSDTPVLAAFEAFCARANLIVAVDHSGRAGNGFFQAIFDQHHEVLTCPWMHYIYSYIETEFPDCAEIDSAALHAFLTTRGYFRFLYNEVDETRSGQIARFGGDPTAPLDRQKLRETFDAIVLAAPRIARRDAVLAMYFSYAVGAGRRTETFRYVLVSDAISLRIEDPVTGFDGRVIDRVIADFPAARISQLVRDPRAAFASTNHQFVNSAGNMYGLHLANFGDSLVRLARGHLDWERVFVFGFLLIYFRQAFLTVERKAAQYPAHFRRLRNEDLNLDFVTTTTSLCGWLSIAPLEAWKAADYVPTMLGRPWTGTGAYNNAYQTSRHGPLENDPDTVARKVTGPNAYVTQRWRTRLAAHEIYLIEWALEDELALYGYERLELSGTTRSSSAWLRRFARPLRGELPRFRWIAKGWQLGWREGLDRVFFCFAFAPFYLGGRIQFLRAFRRLKAPDRS